MFKKRSTDPFVIGFVVTILVVSILILSGSANAESRPVGNDVNYDYVHDEYDQNINSYDEYYCEEYDNEKNNENHIWNMPSI